MKLLLLVLTVLASLTVQHAHAESRTPAEATVHALDELANAIAQGKITRTPTPTTTVTPTLTPRPTNTPTLEPAATETPSATATPEPCWLTDPDLGDPDGNYIVFAEDGTPVPCPLEDQPLPDDEPTPDAEPRAVSVETPTPVRPVQAPATVASRPVAAVAPAPQVQVRTVIQTVVVTAVLIDTPIPSPTALQTATPRATPAATLTRTPTATPSPTATATRTPLPVAAASVTARGSVSGPGRWSWPAFFGYLAAATGTLLLVVALLLRKRVAVWKPRKVAPHA